MNLITYRFGLDLAKHGSQVVLSGMKVGDTNRAIDVALSVNGEPFYLGAEHVATIRTKVYTDLEMYEFEDACQIRENRVFYILAPEILSYPGEIHAELVIGTAGTEIFSTARFVFFAKGENNGEPELPENTYNSVLTALADAKYAKDKSITDAEVNDEGSLVFTLYNENEIDAGNVVGPQGERGEQGPQGERGEQGPQGERGEVDYSLVANALKGTASGAAVSMKDVSPLDHEVKVQLSGESVTLLENIDATVMEMENTDYPVISVEYNSAEDLNVAWINDTEYFYIVDGDISDYVSEGDVIRVEGSKYYLVKKPDFTAVTLTRYGKNLLSPEFGSWTNYGGITFKDNKDGTITINGTAEVSMWIEYFGKNNEGDPNHAIGKGSYVFNDFKNITDKRFRSALLVFTPNKELLRTYEHYNSSVLVDIPQEAYLTYQLRISSGLVCDNVVLKPQLEIGSTPTEYEPYKEPVSYTPNADGTVDGVKSLYPTTTLVTDAESVTIEAEYNRDINKAFTEIYQAIAQMGAAAVTIPEEV